MPLQSSFIPTFALPSLDPPGEKRELFPPYDQPGPPFKRGVLTNEMIKRVSIMNPLSTLHRSLIPDLGQKWKPPIFYYGWSIGELFPRFLQYAEEHGLTRYTHTIREHVVDKDNPDIKGLWNNALWGSADEEDEEDTDQLVVDDLTSAQNALLSMVREEGVHTRYNHRRSFRIRGVMQCPSGRVISIYSNHELEHAVLAPQEDIEKVQKYLGIQQEPAWYVSSAYATWEMVAPKW